MQMAFGFLSSFLMLYVTDKVIMEYLGEASIGILQGLIAYAPPFHHPHIPLYSIALVQDALWTPADDLPTRAAAA
jgi:hypothetical protein